MALHSLSKLLRPKPRAEEVGVLLGEERSYPAVKRQFVPKPRGKGTLEGEVEEIRRRVTCGRDGPYFLDLAAQSAPHATVFSHSAGERAGTMLAVALRYWVKYRIPSLLIDRHGGSDGLASGIARIGGVVLTPPSFKVDLSKPRGRTPSETVFDAAKTVAASLDADTERINGIGVEDRIARSIFDNGVGQWRRGAPRLSETSGYFARHSYYPAIRRLGAAVIGLDGLCGREETDFLDLALRAPTCVDLSGLESLAQKNFVTNWVLQRLKARLDLMREPRLRIILAVDDYDGGRVNVRLHTQDILATLLSGGRKMGLGVVVGAADLAGLHRGAAFSPVQIVYGTDAPDEAKYVLQMMGPTMDEPGVLEELKRGEAFVIGHGGDAALVNVVPLRAGEVPEPEFRPLAA